MGSLFHGYMAKYVTQMPHDHTIERFQKSMKSKFIEQLIQSLINISFVSDIIYVY